MSPPPGGSKAPARGGTTRLRPTVTSVNTAKEAIMTTTLLDYSALLAEQRIADLRREAEADRKVRAALAARPAGRGPDVPALLLLAALMILALVGGYFGVDSRDGGDWSPPRPRGR